MQKTFSIGQAVSYGWTRALGNWRVLSVYALIMLVVSALFSSLSSATQKQSTVLYIVVMALNIVVTLYLALAGTRAALIEAGGAKATWRDLRVQSLRLYGRFVGTTALLVLIQIALVVAFGLVALLGNLGGGVILMPVVFVAAVAFLAATVLTSVRLKLSTFAVVDGAPDARPVQSVKAMWAMTRGNFWKLLGFMVVLGLINVLGAIVVLIGLLVTIPLSLVATAHVYRALKAASEAVPAD